MKNIKVVSWNIAGGRQIKSDQRFDYHEEDLVYFADQIKVLEPDVIFLQEVHFSEDFSTSNLIARKLNMDNVYDHELSPSHIDKDYKLGNSIITKAKADSESKDLYPYPDFDLYFVNNGKKAERHDKGIQSVFIDKVCYANTHLPPLGLFGYNYLDGKGKKFGEDICDILIMNLKTPLIFAGDFSGDFDDKFFDTFSNLISKFSLEDSLNNEMTRNIDSSNKTKYKTDYILYSDDFELKESKIVETNTDHFLCYSEFILL